MRLPISPLAVDHPGRDIANGPCHDEREQRVFRCVPGHKALALTYITVSLREALTCLSRIVLALAVHSPDDVRGTPGDIVERFPHLIQDMLG
jgi:hypothetical protein